MSADCSANSASVAEANGWASMSRIRVTTMADATSPPACPPMPSATTNSWRPAKPESWLFDRTLPTWETAAALVVVAIHLPPELDRRGADLDWRVQRDLHGRVHAFAGEERAVRRVEVLDHPLVV